MVGDMATNKKLINEDVMTRNILNQIRNKNTNQLIKEGEENRVQGLIAITNDPKFGQEVLKNQIDEFRSIVDGGAQFAKENPNSPDESPLVYDPNEENVLFSGTIPSMNNLKWQFKLKDSDGTGLFIWSEGLRLSDENMKTLNKLHGHYINWKKQWQESSGMLENLGKSNE